MTNSLFASETRALHQSVDDRASAAKASSDMTFGLSFHPFQLAIN